MNHFSPPLPALYEKLHNADLPGFASFVPPIPSFLPPLPPPFLSTLRRAKEVSWYHTMIITTKVNNLASYLLVHSPEWQDSEVSTTNKPTDIEDSILGRKESEEKNKK